MSRSEKSSRFPRRVMDISLAKKVIDYNPATTLLEGLKETWEWFITHHDDEHPNDEHLKRKNYFKNSL